MVESISESTRPRDLAGVRYWNGNWRKPGADAVIDPLAPGLWTYVWRRSAGLLREIFDAEGLHGEGVQLIEAGCAASHWLPHFAKAHGFRVTGVDYSEVGCERARQALSARGADGEIVCADLFDPPQHLRDRFDVVFSNGLVEHFDDTRACVTALARFVRPGGILVTFIPNLTGAAGFLQKHLNRPVYDVHVPITREGLRRAHADSGLRVLRSQYFLFANSGVIEFDPISPARLAGKVAPWVRRGLAAGSLVSFWADGETGWLPPNRLTSPYVICVAKRPEA